MKLIHLFIFTLITNISLYSKDQNSIYSKDQNSINAVQNLKAYAFFKAGNYADAKNLWENLAKKGNTTALINLANLFEQGTGVKQNKKEALEYITKAAKLNDERAQYELGLHYEKGMLVKYDIEKAEYWLEKSAKNGSADGQLAYGILLATARGRGIENITYKETINSLKWLKSALKEGQEEAREYIKLLEKLN